MRWRPDRLTITFGGVKAVDDVSFAARPGEIFAIIGPNGAGKTTLFNLLSGIYAPRDGRVLLGGEDVTGEAPHKLARRGLSRTFQNLQIFLRMSAAENVMVGRHLHEKRNVFAHFLALAQCVAAEQGDAAAGRVLAGTCRVSAVSLRVPQAPCPTARSSAWRSRVRSRPSPRCCCSTNRRRAATRSRPGNSKRSSAASRATASRWCWWSTTCGW